jgi:hypothetical protein
MTMDESKQDMKSQIDAMRAKFAEQAKTMHGQVVKAVEMSCALIEGEAKRSMADTLTDPSVSYGRRGHHPSVPFNAPAPDTGMLMRSVTHNVEFEGSTIRGTVGSVINNPPYPAYLENGTTHMYPRPWLLPALDKYREKVKGMFKLALTGKSVSND